LCAAARLRGRHANQFIQPNDASQLLRDLCHTHQAEQLLCARLRGRHAADDVVLERRPHQAAADVHLHVARGLRGPAPRRTQIKPNEGKAIK